MNQEINNLLKSALHPEKKFEVEEEVKMERKESDISNESFY